MQGLIRAARTHLQRVGRLQGCLPAYRRSRIIRCRAFSESASSEVELGDEDDDFGDYEIILPPDPPIWGVSHISPRSVPLKIHKPPYVKEMDKDLSSSGDADPYHGDPYYGTGRLDLGTESEARLREAALLASRTLALARELVEVTSFLLFRLSCIFRNMLGAIAKGWNNDEHHRHRFARVHYLAQRISISAALRGLSTLCLYQREQHRRSRHS